MSNKIQRPILWGLLFLLAIYLVYSSFGVAGPFLWGHHGYHGATYLLRAKMSLRFHMVTPVYWSGFEIPTKDSYYLHHPIGYHHILTLLMAILGDHEWLARGTAALGGLGLLVCLYRLVARLWAPHFGLLAVLLYISLPILCSFSVLSDPMHLAMAGCILTVDLFLRYLDEPRPRLLAWACLVYVLGGLLMWEAYFQAFFHGIFALGYAVSRGRGRRMGRLNAYFVWFAVTGLITTLTMAFHLYYTYKVGMLDDFLASFRQRHSTNWAFFYTQHRRWMELLYGWPPIAMGALWLAGFFGRLISGRARQRDQAVLIFLLINMLYTYLFAQGASLHLYRVFWVSTFFCLAGTDLCSELFGLLSGRRQVAIGAVAALVVGYLALEVPHAYRNLLESRVMMGTHGHPGYNAEQTKIVFAQQVAARTGPQDYVVYHAGLRPRMEFQYYLDRSNRPLFGLSQVEAERKKHDRLVLLLDLNEIRGADRGVLDSLLKEHPAEQFDQYMMVDLRQRGAGQKSYRLAPQRPSWAYRWFVSHRYPPLLPVPR